MKTSIIKLFVIVAFLISIGIASSPALAELVTVTSGDVLEIRFDVPVLPSPDTPSPDTDVFRIFATESTRTGYFEAVTDIFIEDVFYGTYTLGRSQIDSIWVTDDSPYECYEPQVEDGVLAACIWWDYYGFEYGLTRMTITGDNSITFDTEAVQGGFYVGTNVCSYTASGQANILSVTVNTLFSELDSSFGSKTITIDHQTDKKWLDLNLTTNRSYDEIVAEMLPGGDFEGFRHATTDEVLELFSNAGFSLNVWAPWNYNPFTLLVSQIGTSREIRGFSAMGGFTGDTTGTPPDVLVDVAFAFREDRPENSTYKMGIAYESSPSPSDSKYEESGHWLIAVDDNTLPGNNVEVSDEETGITVTFGTVTAGGVTSIELVEIGEEPPPPAGFTIVPLGMYYDIDTTAEFSGLILIEIEYDDTGLTEGEETALKLKHYDEAAGTWEDKTTSVDIANNIIYGETNHLSFFAITMPRLVEIDIKPGSYPNSINPNAGGVIPVAILTTDDFDASNVDPETVALDGEGARGKGKSGKFGSLEDVDGDGDLDLVVQIENVITWDLNATEAMLTGETYDGIIIEGTDSVRIVPLE